MLQIEDLVQWFQQKVSPVDKYPLRFGIQITYELCSKCDLLCTIETFVFVIRWNMYRYLDQLTTIYPTYLFTYNIIYF